ncbi:hypothetical protein LLS1_18210 [Leifsonia sp. LS1]|uniref:helix-turn-helix domain-containing protein n=1 Tax=Leifsonia sp. LS1 TaxID=2828483 RepID=UPI001CFCC4F5|nr:helix-turn-helix domain-containing protein [Leifsonia sp. LS1]GIT80152.1 hypothetical protein LLS1_18210 [Leifsonia sp. LS1]
MSQIADVNTVEETARIFGVSAEVVRTLIDDFFLGTLRVGGNEIVPRRAIEEFIENNTTPAIFANPWGTVDPIKVYPRTSSRREPAPATSDRRSRLGSC